MESLRKAFLQSFKKAVGPSFPFPPDGNAYPCLAFATGPEDKPASGGRDRRERTRETEAGVSGASPLTFGLIVT